MIYDRRVPPPSGLVARAIVVAATTLLLAACGGDDEPGDGTAIDPAPTPESSTTATAPSGLPECEEAWVPGESLPRDYDGCVHDGAEVPPEKHRCALGYSLITYDNTMYAAPGKVINEVADLASSSQWKRALQSCQG